MVVVAVFALGCTSGSGGGGCAVGFGVETEHRAVVERFVVLRDRYFVRHLLFNPVTATYLGADGYSDVLQSTNGSLKDYSDAALARELGFYREIQQELRGVSLEHLPAHLRVDHRLMDAQLKYLIRLIADRRYQLRAVDTYTTEPFRGVDLQILQMQDASDGRRGSESDWQHVLSRVEMIPGYLDRARVNLTEGVRLGNVPDWRMVQRDGIESSLANVEYFRQTLTETARLQIGDRPFGQTFIPRLKSAGDSAAAAWQGFAQFLGAIYDVNDRTDRFAAGVEEYEWRVRNVFGDTRTASELFDYGGRQVALYAGLIQKVAALIASDAGLGAAGSRDVVNHLAKDSPTSDDELFAWYRDTAARAVAYGREHRLFAVPEDYTLDILPTPPVLRNSIDAAYYMAPPFRASGVGRFYLTPTDGDAAALRLKNRASIADTAVHEGFPGHDWHFKYMKRHADEISNVRWLTPGGIEDSSSMWSDSPSVEGWALYAEELMAEPAGDRPYGFYSAPEYLYELKGQMMRAVRVRVDVGIHTGRMTFGQAREYFVEHVELYPQACGRSDADARAACDAADRAVYRYSKWPTQAISYNLGKSTIVALRDETKKQMGTAYSPRTFHERFMRMGPVPVAFFRDVFGSS